MVCCFFFQCHWVTANVNRNHIKTNIKKQHLEMLQTCEKWDHRRTTMCVCVCVCPHVPLFCFVHVWNLNMHDSLCIPWTIDSVQFHCSHTLTWHILNTFKKYEQDDKEFNTHRDICFKPTHTPKARSETKTKKANKTIGMPTLSQSFYFSSIFLHLRRFSRWLIKYLCVSTFSVFGVIVCRQ